MPESLAPHVTQHWQLRKPAARGGGGMVVSQVKAAAEAGALMLEAGGTAADAAVATAFALAALEPWNSGLGGIGFAQAMKPGMARAETFDFGPVSPAGLDPAAYPLTGGMKRDLFPWPEVEGDRNVHGPLSFVVPSAVAGYALLHETHGRLPIRDVLAPAVALAKRGLPQDWYTTLKVASSAAVLRLYPESARVYLPNGLPPVPPYQGSPGYFTLGNLPATLERLQQAGLRDLYEGEIAAQIAADVKAMGGLPRRRRPRRLPRPHPAFRRRPLARAGADAGQRPDRRADPATGAGRHGGCRLGRGRALSRLVWPARPRHAGCLCGTPRRIGRCGPPRENPSADSCTTHITVADRDGMMVAMTTTLLSSMGSRVMLPGTGIMMNNGVMWFDPVPGTPNAIGPGKRALNNMCPVIAASGGQPEIAVGASGGRRIMASVFQLLSFVADFGMEPEAAAHHPRIDVSGPSGIGADRRLPEAVLAALQAEGEVELLEHGVMPINFACPNLVQRGPAGVVGISDAASPWSAAVAAG